MNKTKEKEIEELIYKDIEEKTRVEMKPVPPSQLDRIERMMKWLVIDSMIVDEERLSHTNKGNELKDQIPDISDIIKGK